MRCDSEWPERLFAGCVAVALMAGAAGLGGSAFGWLERARGPVVAVHAWQGVSVSPSFAIRFGHHDVQDFE